MNATIEPPARGIVSRYDSDSLPDPDASPARAARRPAAAPPAPTAEVPQYPCPPLRRPGNQLGEEAPIAPVELAVAVQRHLDALKAVVDVAVLAKAAAGVAEQKRVMDAHNLVLCQRATDRLSHIYAEHPSPENLQRLNDSRVLEPHDHVKVAEYCRIETRKIMAAVTPMCRALCEKAAELVSGDAHTAWERECAFWSEWGLAPPAHALVRGLQALAETLRGQSLARVDFGELPDIMVELLRLTNNLPASPAKPQ